MTFSDYLAKHNLRLQEAADALGISVGSAWSLANEPNDNIRLSLAKKIFTWSNGEVDLFSMSTAEEGDSE